MTLKNIIVTFTVTIPEIEVNTDEGLQLARRRILNEAWIQTREDENIVKTIVDCPDYSAICSP